MAAKRKGVMDGVDLGYTGMVRWIKGWQEQTGQTGEGGGLQHDPSTRQPAACLPAQMGAPHGCFRRLASTAMESSCARIRWACAMSYLS